MRKAVLAAGCSLLLTACSETKVMTCEDEMIHLQFKGFTFEELDTVLIRRFESGSSFSRAGTTDTLTGPENGAVVLQDTIRMDYNYQWALRPGADYEVVVLSTGSRVRVSDIRQEGQKAQTYKQPWMSKVDLQPCLNAVTGFWVDSVQVKIAVPESEILFATLRR